MVKRIVRASSYGCRGVTWGIAGFLIVAATAKFVSGHKEDLAVSRYVYHLIAAFELVLAILMVGSGRFRGPCLWCVALLCLTGSVYSYWFDKRPCGCFGSVWVLDTATHSAINAIVGLVCLLVVTTPERARRP